MLWDEYLYFVTFFKYLKWRNYKVLEKIFRWMGIHLHMTILVSNKDRSIGEKMATVTFEILVLLETLGKMQLGHAGLDLEMAKIKPN